MFVWALALCGLRIHHCASADCNGTTGRLHMIEIEVDQDTARACYHDGVHDLAAVPNSEEVSEFKGVR